MSGKAIYVTATFHVAARLLAGDPERDCQYLLEKYLEDFTQHARYHLKCQLGNGELALFAVFDSSTGRLPWHAPLVLNDIEMTREGLNLDRCEFIARHLSPLVPESAASERLSEALSSRAGVLPKLSKHKEEVSGPEPFIGALRKALSLDAACIGEFQVPHNGSISLTEQNAIHYQLAKLRR